MKEGRKERLGSHKDISSLTLLFQDDCGGLEVEMPGENGRFVAATLVEGALLMNIGDVSMRLSNGKTSFILFVFTELYSLEILESFLITNGISNSLEF